MMSRAHRIAAEHLRVALHFQTKQPSSPVHRHFNELRLHRTHLTRLEKEERAKVPSRHLSLAF
jgi:hypothetical protein